MFNIGAGELFIIFLVAFFIVGPKDLPKVIKGIKEALQWLRNLVKDLKAETGWDDIVKEVSEVKDDVTGTVKSLDITKDLKDAKKSVEDTVKDLDIKQDFEEAKSALEKGVNTIKSPLKSAAASIKAEFDPKAVKAALKETEPATAANGDNGSAPAEEPKSGPEAEKTEEEK
ncbi:MAG: twin-arginine translocase TatA/TatE family subunit [Christensenellales bacterium]|jgi:sec-independent protein translocase protein TatB